MLPIITRVNHEHEVDRLVAEALARQEMDGERLTNRCRIALLLVGGLDLALVWNQQTPAAARFFLIHGLCVCAFAGAVEWTLYDRHRYLPRLMYLTVFIDVSYVFAYTVASLLNHSGVYAIYRSPFMWLLLATVNALSGLRHRASASLLAGGLTLVYGGLQLLGVMAVPVEWSHSLEFVGRRLNLANAVQTIVLASVPAWVAAVVANRSRQLVVREARAAAERASLEERHRYAIKELDALRELANAKDRFLNIASHELRSPIAALRMTVQLAAVQPDQVTDPDKGATFLARLERQSTRLTHLVDQLLETARLGRELPLNPETSDLAQLCLNSIEALPRDRNQVLLESAESLVGIWDPLRIEQVITNLLSNALRYSPPGAPVRLSVSATAEWAIVTVSDRGMGIPRSELGRLFTPFFRAENARKTHGGGLGLGLYITHEIVRRHGGNIRVMSEVGLGTTFVVELPR